MSLYSQMPCRIVFLDFLDWFVITFVDDILVYSKSEVET